MRRWPYFVTLSLGLVPVGLFAVITTVLVVKSAPAVADPGLRELLSRDFASQFTTGGAVTCTPACTRSAFTLGLLPAVWGTILITGIAMLLAVPASLALAIVAAGEFSLGPLGRVVRLGIGVLGGVPSIVYALLAVVFVKQFMVPKFTGGMSFGAFDPAKVGAAPDSWPPDDVPWNAGALPWDPTGLNNSTLLGGVLIALLVIPFVAPLMDDAIRGVATSMKEASLSLGASRWDTLRRITLPQALPGILSAVSLGVLRAMGDTLIVVFVIGWEANRVPTPAVDVLERMPGLTAVGANLLGGFQGNATCQDASCSVGYGAVLTLLVIAVVIVVATGHLQTLVRRRLAQ